MEKQGKKNLGILKNCETTTKGTTCAMETLGEKRQKDVFETTVTKNFLVVMSGTKPQMQETQELQPG